MFDIPFSLFIISFVRIFQDFIMYYLFNYLRLICPKLWRIKFKLGVCWSANNGEFPPQGWKPQASAGQERVEGGPTAGVFEEDQVGLNWRTFSAPPPTLPLPHAQSTCVMSLLLFDIILLVPFIKLVVYILNIKRCTTVLLCMYWVFMYWVDMKVLCV